MGIYVQKATIFVRIVLHKSIWLAEGFLSNYHFGLKTSSIFTDLPTFSLHRIRPQFSRECASGTDLRSYVLEEVSSVGKCPACIFNAVFFLGEINLKVF